MRKDLCSLLVVCSLVVGVSSALAGAGPNSQSTGQQSVNSAMQSDIDKLKADTARLSEAKSTQVQIVQPVVENNPYYVGIVGGYVFDTNSVVGSDNHLQSDDGYSYGVVAGREFGKFSFEGEVGYQKTDNSHVDDLTLSGSSSLLALMANLVYTYPILSNVGVYGKVGVGAGEFNLSDGSIDESATVFIGNVGAGVTYTVTPAVAIDMGWKYIAMGDTTLLNKTVSYDSNAATIGVRYKF